MRSNWFFFMNVNHSCCAVGWVDCSISGFRLVLPCLVWCVLSVLFRSIQFFSVLLCSILLCSAFPSSDQFCNVKLYVMTRNDALHYAIVHFVTLSAVLLFSVLPCFVLLYSNVFFSIMFVPFRTVLLCSVLYIFLLFVLLCSYLFHFIGFGFGSMLCYLFCSLLFSTIMLSFNFHRFIFLFCSVLHFVFCLVCYVLLCLGFFCFVLFILRYFCHLQDVSSKRRANNILQHLLRQRC